MQKAILLLIIILLVENIWSYTFCNTSMYVIGYSRYLTTDQHPDSDWVFIAPPNKSKLYCVNALTADEVVKRWKELGVILNTIDCERGQIGFNDSTVIYFNDEYAAIRQDLKICTEDDTFPYPVANLELYNRMNEITQRLGISTDAPIYITQTKIEPLTTSSAGIFEPLNDDDKQNVDNLFINNRWINPASYYTKLGDMNWIWIFDKAEKNKLIILGPDYIFFQRGSGNGYLLDFLKLEYESNLNRNTLNDLTTIDNYIDSLELQINSMEKISINSQNISIFEDILNSSEHNKTFYETLTLVRSSILKIKKEQAVRESLFESDRYSSVIREFVNQKTIATSIEIDEKIRLFENRLNYIEQKKLNLEQNLENKIQFETNKSYLTTQQNTATLALMVSIIGLIMSISLFKPEYKNIVFEYLYKRGKYQFTWLQLLLLSFFLLAFSLLGVNGQNSVVLITFSLSILYTSLIMYVLGMVSPNAEKIMNKKVIYGYPLWGVTSAILFGIIFELLWYKLPIWTIELTIAMIFLLFFKLMKKSLKGTLYMRKAPIDTYLLNVINHITIHLNSSFRNKYGKIDNKNSEVWLKTFLLFTASIYLLLDIIQILILGNGNMVISSILAILIGLHQTANSDIFGLYNVKKRKRKRKKKHSKTKKK